MHIEHIAIRISDRRDPEPGDIPLGHPYRCRWWLPVIGPTATILLDHLTAKPADGWTIHDTVDLATSLGLGTRTGVHSPLIRTFSRIARYGIGTFDIEPGHPGTDPCITLWATIGLVPERVIRR